MFKKCLVAFMMAMFVLGSAVIVHAQSSGYFCPERGDQITHVNNIKIRDADHFSSVIRNSNTRIVFRLVDHKTGEIFYLATNLLPKGSSSRLGIYIEDDYRGGVMVTGVMSGMPGSRCLRMLPEGEGFDGNDSGNDDGYSGGNLSQWTAPIYHPEKGDRIIYVNDTKIRDLAHFWNVIRSANTRIELTLVDHRSGNRYVLMTDLLPKGAESRLGIYVEDDSRGGVRVVGTIAGLPGTKCRSLKNSNVPPRQEYYYDDSDYYYYHDHDHHHHHGDQIIIHDDFMHNRGEHIHIHEDDDGYYYYY